MSPRYRVTLTNEEIKELELLTRNGKTPQRNLPMPGLCSLAMHSHAVPVGRLPTSLQLWA